MNILTCSFATKRKQLKLWFVWLEWKNVVSYYLATLILLYALAYKYNYFLCTTQQHHYFTMRYVIISVPQSDATTFIIPLVFSCHLIVTPMY